MASDPRSRPSRPARSARPRRRAAVLALALTIGLAVAAPAYAAPDPATTDTTCAGADLQPTADNLSQIAQATLCLLNLERGASSLPALSEQAQLTQASAAYSADMVARQFFEHVSPDGKTLVNRLTATGFLGTASTWAVGENIAWGTGSLATPRSIVVAWMNSAGHRANILEPMFREIGLGIALGVPAQGLGDGATYTTDFGMRDPDSGAAPAARSATHAAVRSATPRSSAKRAPAGSRCATATRRLARATRVGAGKRDRQHTKRLRAAVRRACTKR
jgi:uncharacterized protein YkwD